MNSKQEDADTISEILLRAAREPEFRNQLIKQPSNVLEQYNISDEAKSIIKNSIIDLTQYLSRFSDSHSSRNLWPGTSGRLLELVELW
ncbi:MAG: hypothetical protein WA220_03105 [Candidatus Nitrosopolaris sp.]